MHKGRSKLDNNEVFKRGENLWRSLNKGLVHRIDELGKMAGGLSTKHFLLVNLAMITGSAVVNQGLAQYIGDAQAATKEKVQHVVGSGLSTEVKEAGEAINTRIQTKEQSVNEEQGVYELEEVNTITELSPEESGKNTIVELEVKENSDQKNEAKEVQKKTAESMAEFLKDKTPDSPEALAYKGPVHLDKGKLQSLLKQGLKAAQLQRAMAHITSIEKYVNELGKELGVNPFAILVVIYSESKFDYQMVNPSSKAYGLIQFLGATKQKIFPGRPYPSFQDQLGGMKRYFNLNRKNFDSAKVPRDLKIYVLGQNTNFSLIKRAYSEHAAYKGAFGKFSEDWERLKGTVK